MGSSTWRSWAIARHVAGTRAPEPEATGGRVSIFGPGGRAHGSLRRWLEIRAHRATSSHPMTFVSIREATCMSGKSSGRRAAIKGQYLLIATPCKSSSAQVSQERAVESLEILRLWRHAARRCTGRGRAARSRRGRAAVRSNRASPRLSSLSHTDTRLREDQAPAGNRSAGAAFWP